MDNVSNKPASDVGATSPPTPGGVGALVGIACLPGVVALMVDTSALVALFVAVCTALCIATAWIAIELR